MLLDACSGSTCKRVLEQARLESRSPVCALGFPAHSPYRTPLQGSKRASPTHIHMFLGQTRDLPPISGWFVWGTCGGSIACVSTL